MDREAHRSVQTDAARHHRRSASYLPTSTTLKDLGRDRSDKLQELARIKTTSRSSKADLDTDYVLPGIPPLDRRLPLVIHQRSDTEGSKVGKYDRARPLILTRQASLEDMGVKNSGRNHIKSSLEDGGRTSRYATLPRQGRPHDFQAANTHDSIEPGTNGTDIFKSISKISRSSKDENGRLEYIPQSRSRRSDVKHISESFDLDRRGSPGRSVYGRRMLHLMGATRGEMKGRLSFRMEPSQMWASALCSIDQDTGSLLCEHTSEKPSISALVKDLRGCRVQTLLDPEYSTALLVLRPKDSADVIQLRPEDGSQADTWFAAFLCWQPLQPMQSLCGSRAISEPKGSSSAAASGSYTREQTHVRKSPAIIKVGKAFYLEPKDSDTHIELSSPMDMNQNISENASHNSPLWNRVSCTLRDNGELKIYTTADVSTLATIRLSDLARSAVQRVHSSVSRLEFCVAIYSTFATPPYFHSRSQPIFLSFDSRVLFEVWFVLFSTFTSPEIQRFGPPPTAHSRRYSVMLPGAPQEAESYLFRVERSLHVQVAEARLKSLNNDAELGYGGGSPRHSGNGAEQSSSTLCFAQVSLDGQLKAKTSVKPNSSYLFWYESFNILDIPPQATDIVVQAKCRTFNSAPGSPRLHRSPRGILSIRRSENIQVANEVDAVHGEVRIDLNKLRPGVETERWWKLKDGAGNLAGELLLKIRPEREVILMDCEYSQLSEMLHQEPCHMTTRIAAKIPAELSRLAECLLNIFQASGQAGDWLMSLAEEEIEGIRRELPSARSRSDARLDSSASRDSAGSPLQNGSQASSLKNSTLSEANLLFRGNTLLSKSLDLHMKRLGKDYLEGTIGAKMRAIADQDPECEVDPNRMKGGMDLQENWHRLLSLTREVWSLIYDSCARCPPELRMIFRHIKVCTDDRYGERLPNVRYSSVSGFLFLRFFCPAVLNPSLFGLLSENPTPRAQRTFTLIAKSLQGLANQALFGVKEPWMGLMNQFLNAYTQQFRDFLDSICSLSRDQEVPSMSPSYSTPLAMFTRLPQISREGLPSLPYLIDHTRHFAALVSLWTDSYPSKSTNQTVSVESLDPDIRRFHEICVQLRKRTLNCLAQTEQDEKRRSTVSEKWQELAERIESKPGEFWVDPARPAIFSTRSTSDTKVQTNGRTTPSTPLPMSAGPTSDDFLPSGTSGIASGPPSSVQLSSPNSSDMEQAMNTPPSKGKKDLKEKDISMLNLLARRIRR